MNLSTIKSLTIPEGKVKSISVGGVKVWSKTPEIPEENQLLAPTIALSGDTLQITDTSGLATSFNILVDGVVKGSVEVEQEETYTIPAGTYMFGETPTYPTEDLWVMEGNINFVSNDEIFTAIGYGIPDTYGREVYYRKGSEYIAVASPVASESEYRWTNEAYRTITVKTDQIVSQEFYNWFVSNTLITFTIDGTTYQAENGMTWEEWCNSSYNTLGLVNAGYEINNDGSTSYKNLKYTDMTIVNPSDTIIVNYAYILSGGAGA